MAPRNSNTSPANQKESNLTFDLPVKNWVGPGCQPGRRLLRTFYQCHDRTRIFMHESSKTHARKSHRYFVNLPLT